MEGEEGGKIGERAESVSEKGAEARGNGRIERRGIGCAFMIIYE